MQFRATIPDGNNNNNNKPGTIVPVNCSGVVVYVQLPKGKPGEPFTFELPRDAWEAAKSSGSSIAYDGSMSKDNTGGGRSKGKAAQNHKPLPAQQMIRRRRSLWARLTSTVGPLVQQFCLVFRFCNILNQDGELSNLSKVLILILAFVSSITTGFVFGILSVTSPDDLLLPPPQLNNGGLDLQQQQYLAATTASAGGSLVGMTIQQSQQTTVIRQNPDGTTTVQQTNSMGRETTTLSGGQELDGAGFRVTGGGPLPTTQQQQHILPDGRPEL